MNDAILVLLGYGYWLLRITVFTILWGHIFL